MVGSQKLEHRLQDASYPGLAPFCAVRIMPEFWNVVAPKKSELTGPSKGDSMLRSAISEIPCSDTRRSKSLRRNVCLIRVGY